MAGDNPLVAQAPKDPNGPGPLTAGNGDYGWGTGLGIAESAMDTFNGIKDGSWVDGGLGVVGLAAEVASAAIDPFGWLMSSAASFLMEHMQPLKDMLDSVAGKPPVIQSYAETWGRVAKALGDLHTDFANEVKGGTAGWTGEAADAYRASAGEQAEALDGAATLAGTISTVVAIMGEVVSFVRETVRDLIADLVGRLISWVLEEVFSLGFGTPVVVAQAVTAISKWGEKIADLLRRLVETIKRVSPLLGRLAEIFGKIVKVLGKLAGKFTGLDVINTKHIVPGGFVHRGGGHGVDLPGGGGHHGGGSDTDGGGSGSHGSDGSGTSGSDRPNRSGEPGDSGRPSDSDGPSGADGGSGSDGPSSADRGSGSDGSNGAGGPHGSGGGSRGADGSGATTNPAGGPSAGGSGGSHRGGGSGDPAGSGGSDGSHGTDGSPGGRHGDAGGSDRPSTNGHDGEPAGSSGSSGDAGNSRAPSAHGRSSGGDTPSDPGGSTPAGTHAGGGSAGTHAGGGSAGHAGGDSSPGTGRHDGNPGAPHGNPSTGTSAAAAPPRVDAPDTPHGPAQRDHSPNGSPGSGSPYGGAPPGQATGGLPPAGTPGGTSSGGGSPGGRAGRGGWTGTPGSPAPATHGGSGPGRGSAGAPPHGPGSSAPPRTTPSGYAPGGRTPAGPGGRDASPRHDAPQHPVPRGGTGAPHGAANQAPSDYGPGARTGNPDSGGRRPEGLGRDPQHAPHDGQHRQDGQHRHDGDAGGPDHDTDRNQPHDGPQLTPDEVNQHHAEPTPAGTSYHHGDPDMGDLPHRVPPDPDGRYTVDVHVTPDGRARIGGHTYSPEEFADILRRNGDYDGRPIRLIGCDAGSNDFAQRLSRELDTPVLAPTKPAWTDSHGRVFSSDYEIGPDGRARPKIPPNGEWETHHPDGHTSRAGDDGFTPHTGDADKHHLDPDNARARGDGHDHGGHDHDGHDHDGVERDADGHPVRTVDQNHPLSPAANQRFGHGDDVHLDPNTRYRVTDQDGKVRGEFVTDADGRIREIHTTSGRKDNWNIELLRPAHPDATYHVKGVNHEYVFRTDGEGRTVEASGTLEHTGSIKDRRMHQDPQRIKEDQTSIGQEGKQEYDGYNQEQADRLGRAHSDDPLETEPIRFADVGWDGGHLIANEFGGPGEPINVVPMLRDLNQNRRYRSLEESWRKMEMHLGSLVKGGKKVDLQIHVDYDHPDAKTPHRLVVEYNVDGVPQDPFEFDNVPPIEW